MTINDMLENYADVSHAAKIRKLRLIVDFVENVETAPEPENDLILALLDVAGVAEDDDYFGSEGLHG